MHVWIASYLLSMWVYAHCYLLYSQSEEVDAGARGMDSELLAVYVGICTLLPLVFPIRILMHAGIDSYLGFMLVYIYWNIY